MALFGLIKAKKLPDGSEAPETGPYAGLSTIERIGRFGDYLAAVGGNEGAARRLAQGDADRAQALELGRRAQAAMEAQYGPQEVGGRILQRDRETGEYKILYDPPVAQSRNDTVADYEFIEGVLGTDAAKAYLRNKTAPSPFIQRNPDGTITAYPQGLQGYGQTPATPAAPSGVPAVGTVRNGDDGSYRFLGGNPRDRNSWQKIGGPAPAGANFPDPFKAPGRVSSGRRTVEGNRLVGGAAHSHHLTGDAVDYTGASMSELQSYFGPKARYLDEGDHIHVTLPGYGKVPYFGKRGTTGRQ